MVCGLTLIGNTFEITYETDDSLCKSMACFYFPYFVEEAAPRHRKRKTRLNPICTYPTSGPPRWRIAISPSAFCDPCWFCNGLYPNGPARVVMLRYIPVYTELGFQGNHRFLRSVG